jgi:tetratricopeptide (TPR) repeat protein
MNQNSYKAPVPRERRRLSTLVPFALLSLALLVVYHNSLEGPFIFDDTRSIVENPDIRHLATALRGNPRIDASRPLMRLSLWINYALGGQEVRGYHVLNLMLHILAAWTLWGLAQRILESPSLRDRYGKEAWGLALAIALLWTVHPLQTESVSYMVQRTEALAGWFYLLTLYSVARSASAAGGRVWWSVTAVVSCLLGMASKETVATAPLLALALDWIFFAPSWRRLWQLRWGLYAALACTWIFQALLLAMASPGRKATGVGQPFGMHWWEYALTQSYYLCRYLVLSVWPGALTLDYGTYLVHGVGEVAPYAAVVLLLLALTCVALWRNPPLGFCGLWFFLILAPTSSVVPILGQTGAEHRMYLPLAGLIGLGVVGGYTLWRRAWRERPGRLQVGSLLVLLAVGVMALGARTVARNEEYRSAVSIWQTVTERWPINSRAYYNLGFALAKMGRMQEAIAQLEEALRLKPDYVEARVNLGNALRSLGRLSEAIAEYQTALRVDPNDADARLNLGHVLASLGRFPEAIAQDEALLRLRPELAAAHLNLGNALVGMSRYPEATAQFEAAVRLAPDLAGAHLNLGNALASEGHLPEAIAQFAEELRLQPDYAQAHMSLANALALTGHPSEAAAEYQAALRLEPDLAGGRLSETMAQLEEALRSQSSPDGGQATGSKQR